MPKTPVKLFTSYAHKNAKTKNKLIGLLTDQLALAKNYTVSNWMDKKILTGDDWENSIETALETCDSGLLLLSPAFFASSTIQTLELPALLSKRAGVIPVMLHPVPFEDTDLKALNGVQIFTLSSKAFSEMRGSAAQEEFSLALFREILRVLDARLAPQAQP